MPIRIVAAFLLALVAMDANAQGRTSERVPRIGWLGSGAPPGGPSELQFPPELEKFGHRIGVSVLLEPRWTAGRVDSYEPLAAELLALGVDLIITSGARCETVFALTRTVPIVCATIDDPIARGLARSYARPGGNVTGIQLMTVELFQKRLEIVREALPAARRLGMLALAETDWLMPSARATAAALGLELDVQEIETEADVVKAFQAFAVSRVDAVVTTQGPLLNRLRGLIVALGMRLKVPTVSGETNSAADGGLIQFGPDVAANWRRAAFYVDRILRGAKPADLPIEQPQVSLIVNLRTAAVLGLTLPRSILARADDVIE